MCVRNERILYIKLLLLLISPPLTESFVFSALKTAVSFAYQAYDIINDAHDTFNEFVPKTILDDVLAQAERVVEKVDHIRAQLSTQITQAVDTVVTRIDDLDDIHEGLEKLSIGFRQIDNLYRLFELYTKRHIQFNNRTLQDYIKQIATVGELALKDVLSDIHDLIMQSSKRRQSFLHHISKDIPRNDTYLCSGLTPQGSIYQIFRLIMVNEIRAFTMMTFAYSLNQAFKCESFEEEIENAEYQLRTRAKDYYDLFTEVAGDIANSIRSCDPSDGWIKGQNFNEFERFYTEYIVSARMLWPDSTQCNPGCGEEADRSRIDFCDSKYQCIEETSCHGGLDACTVIMSPVTVCELGPTGKRYQYSTTGEGETRGNDTDGCLGNEITIEKKNECEICQCSCLEDTYRSRTLRTFSTREQVSDAANNKAVSGVKFVVMENMTHIQIQQGVVLPEGRIVPDSAEWKPLENIKFDEGRTSEEFRYVYHIDSDDGTRYDMEEIEDYVSFSWKTHTINIDDLIVPPGYVVTGVRFAPDGDDEDNQPVQLAIQASPYDYDTGKIEITDDNPSIWLTSADMFGQIPEYDNERTQIVIDGGQNPLGETGEAIPRSSPNSYIIVTSSDIENDGGQTTIPLLDTQEVTGRLTFAAGGIGLYYKSISEEIGGFVGFRLFAVNAMKNMKITVLDKLDKFKEGVADFEGCNDEIDG